MSFAHDPRWTRRHFLRTGTAAFTVSVSGWLGRLAAVAGPDPKRKRSCILLWLNGGRAGAEEMAAGPAGVVREAHGKLLYWSVNGSCGTRRR